MAKFGRGSMNVTTIADAVAAATAELVVQTANTPDLIQDAYRIRHQVYCLERGFEPGRDGLETDAFDAHASHVVLRRAACGTVIGTARLILPRPGLPDASFPMQTVCTQDRLAALPLRHTAEISRFAMCRERRGLSMAATSLSRLALVRGLVQLSQDHGITHWCAMMERTLLRLLRGSAIHFQEMGPAIEYHGLRQPSACHLPRMLDRMACEQPDIWRFVTADGAFTDAADEAWPQKRAA